MDKYVIKGVKKLAGLTRTKIRLAEEAKTLQTRPAPLPLVKLLSGVELETVSDAKDYVEKIVFDFEDGEGTAKTIFELMDIIEGVKHKFEPPEYFALVGEDAFQEIEDRVDRGEQVNILLMDNGLKEGVNLYVGYEPPEGVIHFGRVPTTLAAYLAYALKSSVLSKDMKLKNTTVSLGHGTLILNAIYYALVQQGALKVTP